MLSKQPLLSESDLDLVQFGEFSLNHTPEISPDRYSSCLIVTHRWAIRFSLHLTFVSLFETIFFWKFVSIQEDNALTSLIDSYTNNIWTTCSTLNFEQKLVLKDFVHLFLNSTIIQHNGENSFLQRRSYNNTLIKDSWIYVGSIGVIWVLLSLAAIYQRIPIKWWYIILENIVLVSLLGMYEWMFFSSIVLKYQSISIPELDSQIINKFDNLC